MDTGTKPAAARDGGLDLMKLLATVAVVGLHTLDSGTSWLGLLLYYGCGFCIPLFFMVNGALTLNRAELSWSYALKKSLRLLWMVLLWNLLWAAHLFAAEGRLTDPFTQTLLSLTQQGAFPIFWFFGALILLYLLAPPLHALIARRGYKLPLVCLGALCLGADIVSIFLGWPLQGAVRQTFRLWTWLLFYLLGGLFNSPGFAARIKIPHGKRVLLAVGLTLVSVGWSWLSLHRLTFARPAEFYYDNLFHVLWVCAVFAALKDNPALRRLDRITQRLQPLSLGVYVLHLPLAGYIGLTSALYAGVPFWLALTAASFLVSAVLNRIPYVRRLVSL